MSLWDVRVGVEARKNRKKVPQGIDELFQLLLKEIELAGPVRSAWPNYSKMSSNKNCHHCHLQKGKPTYVAVWKVINKKDQIIKVLYVGTHEGVDYDRICSD